MMFFSKANAVAAALEETPAFVKMLDRCRAIVLSLRKRAAATSLFV